MKGMTKGNEYNGLFSVGQAVYSILYGGRLGYVREIQGEQDPASVRRIGGVLATGGRANLVIRFDTGIESIVPECIVRGVQWEIGGPADTAAIDAAYTQSVADRKAAAQRQADEQNRQRRELPVTFPHLETVQAYEQRTGKRWTQQLVAAINIRTDLKRTFPGVKFSVTSQGNSINVSWHDGPTQSKVNALVNKYQNSDFDPSDDSSHSRNAVFNELFGGATYVFANRHISDETLATLLPWAESLRGSAWYENDISEWAALRLAGRLVQGYAIPSGSTVTGAERIPNVTAGYRIHDFYRLTFAA